MKETYTLPNRYGNVIKLIKIQGNTYSLVMENAEYYRVLGDENDIHAVDPEGGPYLHIGYELDGYEVKEIKKDNGFKITFKKK